MAASVGALPAAQVRPAAATTWQRPDAVRVLQLSLATVWLLDGVLQLHPFMFTPGPSGFSGMLSGVGAGNPAWIARTISWNAAIVDRHPVATDAAFAAVQILIGLGVAWRRSTRAALAASVVWSLGVWWFGEGLGGILAGNGTPIAGGPGAVLFYALLAVLLWPSPRPLEEVPFAAARAVGAVAARAVWAAVWAGLAVLCLLGSGRSPGGVQGVIESVDSGQPGWLAAIDRHTASAVAGHGLAVALVLAAICVVVAAGAFLPPALTRVTIGLAVLTALVIWVVGENFGMILAGGATDPNSGPLIVLLAVAYWPLRRTVAAPPAPVPAPQGV